MRPPIASALRLPRRRESQLEEALVRLTEVRRAASRCPMCLHAHSVKPTEPLHRQIFIGKGKGMDDQEAFERRLFLARKVISNAGSPSPKRSRCCRYCRSRPLWRRWRGRRSRRSCGDPARA